jgi:hypothetical protein
MNYKVNMKTVRLTLEEDTAVQSYIKDHPYITTFSTLVRAALAEYLQPTQEQKPPPSFLWDYDLSHGEILEVLRGPQKQRLWLVAKILEHGKWEEIWQYLTRRQIAADLPILRLPEKAKRHWEYALRRWRKP